MGPGAALPLSSVLIPSPFSFLESVLWRPATSGYKSQTLPQGFCQTVQPAPFPRGAGVGNREQWDHC